MHVFQHTALIAAAALLVSGCASSAGTRAPGRTINLDYAQITNIERVEMPSAVVPGAVLGGFTGLVLGAQRNTGTAIAGAAGGAALGAVAARALEGDRLGYAYDLSFVRGGETRFITEKGFFQIGDCVVIERGQQANLRRVAPSYCGTAPLPPEANEARLLDADQCQEAKFQLLDAQTEEAINVAARKVELLCQF